MATGKNFNFSVFRKPPGPARVVGHSPASLHACYFLVWTGTGELGGVDSHSSHMPSKACLGPSWGGGCEPHEESGPEPPVLIAEFLCCSAQCGLRKFRPFFCVARRNVAWDFGQFFVLLGAMLLEIKFAIKFAHSLCCSAQCGLRFRASKKMHSPPTPCC